MVDITAALVKELRDATNVSMMECKRSLVESEGDIEKATRVLRERGMAVAAKKASRATNQGLIASATADDGKSASLVRSTARPTSSPGTTPSCSSVTTSACTSPSRVPLI